MTIEVGDLCRMNIGINCAGQQCVVTHYIEIDSLGSNTTDGQLATSILDDWLLDTVITGVWNVMNSDKLIVNCLSLQKIQDTEEPKLFVTANVAGTQPGDPYPANKAGMIRYRTQFYRRGSTGRSYWPGPLKAHVHRGRIENLDTGVWGALGDAFVGQKTGGLSAQFTFQHYHPTTQLWDVVIEREVDPIVRSQAQRVSELC